jgi:hypothetical protein
MLTADTIPDTRRKPSEPETAGGWYDPDSIVFQAADDDRAPRLLPRESRRPLLEEGRNPLGMIGGRPGDRL